MPLASPASLKTGRLAAPPRGVRPGCTQAEPPLRTPRPKLLFAQLIAQAGAGGKTRSGRRFAARATGPLTRPAGQRAARLSVQLQAGASAPATSVLSAAAMEATAEGPDARAAAGGAHYNGGGGGEGAGGGGATTSAEVRQGLKCGRHPFDWPACRRVETAGAVCGYSHLQRCKLSAISATPAAAAAADCRESVVTVALRRAQCPPHRSDTQSMHIQCPACRRLPPPLPPAAASLGACPCLMSVVPLLRRRADARSNCHP